MDFNNVIGVCGSHASLRGDPSLRAKRGWGERREAKCRIRVKEGKGKERKWRQKRWKGGGRPPRKEKKVVRPFLSHIRRRRRFE